MGGQGSGVTDRNIDRSSIRVGVVAGGLSHERDISLQSGRKVQHALRTAGFTSTLHDLDPTFVTALRQDQFDLVFPVLHGGVGEDGGLAALLERVGVPSWAAAPRRPGARPTSTSPARPWPPRGSPSRTRS